jgi:hypothetical protein
MASGPVFMFCTPKLVFSFTEGAGSRFHVSYAQTSFRHYRGRRYRFHVLRSRTHFRRFRGRCPVFMFCAPGLVLGGTEGVDPIFMFCPPGLVFDGTEGVGSCYFVLRSRTRFRWCRGRRVPFSRFALPGSFLALPWVSVSVFLFCVAGLVFGVTEGVWSRFHVLRFRPRFQRFRGRPVPFSFFARLYSFSAEPRASGLVFMFCAAGRVLGGTEGVGSPCHVLRS